MNRIFKIEDSVWNNNVVFHLREPSIFDLSALRLEAQWQQPHKKLIIFLLLYYVMLYYIMLCSLLYNNKFFFKITQEEEKHKKTTILRNKKNAQRKHVQFNGVSLDGIIKNQDVKYILMDGKLVLIEWNKERKREKRQRGSKLKIDEEKINKNRKRKR